MLQQYKLTIFFILSIINSYLCQVQLHKYCNNPVGEVGTCIPIMDCRPLLELVQKEDRTTEELLFLRQSKCGFADNSVKVCCVINEIRCFNPDGNLGFCVEINTCPAITKLLKPPISIEDTEFIRNSRCEGPDEYSVCCSGNHTINTSAFGLCKPSPVPPNPRTECCGMEIYSGNKIYRGTELTIDQYPWLSLIEYRSKKDNRIELFFGGALISYKYILTAAHCVVGAILNEGEPVNIRLGEHDTANDGPDCVAVPGGGLDCTDGLVIIPIEKITPHRNYDPKSQLRRNDIALIRMTKDVKYTDFIRPICLPTSDITQSQKNIRLYAAGWGATDDKNSTSNIKLDVVLPYKSLEQCQTAYNLTEPSDKVKLWNGQMCAGGEKDKDTCKGDSGGPLMYNNGRTFSVVGIFNFGPMSCALKDVPGVYTKVYEYILWIRSNIKP